MSALFYFLVWAAVIFVMMRFGCGSHIMGNSHGKAGHGGNQTELPGAEGLRWIPPETDLDPVCGKTVHTSIAKPSVHDGSVYYFCSRDCREIFEAAPRLYVGGVTSTPQPQLENRHV
uniref:YHS domain-containing protein n=1 Tax=Pararhizobium sp. IMCC3301 TaxID=3067904 RepID=UPI002740A6B5|nr:YHS domain-containing protein [Pararhizobium sp. IMCC3301]